MCIVVFENNANVLIDQLQNNIETQVYIEIPPKTCSSLESSYPTIIKATISGNHILNANVLGTFGSMMEQSNKEPRSLGQHKESH